MKQEDIDAVMRKDEAGGWEEPEGRYPGVNKRTDETAGESEDAVLIGWQKAASGGAYPLYQITARNHPSVNSTVTAETLNRLGLKIPEWSLR